MFQSLRNSRSASFRNLLSSRPMSHLRFWFAFGDAICNIPKLLPNALTCDGRTAAFGSPSPAILPKFAIRSGPRP